MPKLTGIYLGATPTMRGMPDVFCLFPPVNPAVSLKTQAGFTLSRGNISQTSGADITLVDGKQVYFVTVPGGSSFAFDPIDVAVPDSDDASFNVAGVVYDMAYSLALSPVRKEAFFTASQPAQPVAGIPYYASVAPDRRVYDVTDCLRDILARYEARPFILKSDRAKVFLCAQWLALLAQNSITPHKIRPHCPQDQGVIERGMREVKTWLRANNPVSEELWACLDEGMFMLNFLKPKMVLNAATAASVYLGRPANCAAQAACEPQKKEVLCLTN